MCPHLIHGDGKGVRGMQSGATDEHAKSTSVIVHAKTQGSNHACSKLKLFIQRHADRSLASDTGSEAVVDPMHA